MNTTALEPQTVAKTLIAVVFVTIVAIFLVTAVPGLVGADHSFVVQSSSMSPTISAGDVVVVAETAPESISEGDVITFQAAGSGSNRVTHRVVSVAGTAESREFVTKGDANADPDDEPVQASDVVGVVAFTIPWIGYVVNFANSDAGLVLLVVVPALLLIAFELWDIYTDPALNETDPDGGDT